MGDAQYRINPALDAVALAEAFRAKGRLHIPDFLVEADADRLLAELDGSHAWTLMMNQGDRLFQIDRSMQAGFTDEKRAKVDEAVYAAARDGFQFRYESIKAPLGDADRAANSSALNSFARFLSSDGALPLLRSITGAADISFADAQATCYGPGHFLTAHDDDANDQDRRVAYVFNLTREWNVDWGGLLTFHDNGSRVVESFVPAFGALNLFTVPQLHSVSYVSPFAGRLRYSVTGWLRAGPRP